MINGANKYTVYNQKKYLYIYKVKCSLLFSVLCCAIPHKLLKVSYAVFFQALGTEI